MSEKSPPPAQLNNKDAKAVYDQLETARKRLKIPDKDKVGFFEKYGDDAVLIGMAKHLNELEKSVGVDHLTGLENARVYKHELKENLDRVKTGESQGFGLIRFDLDNFSWINDVLEAHQFGDVYLQTAAKMLKQATREEDVVARIGGDEFGTIISAANVLNPEQFSRIAERIYQHVDSRVLDQTLQVLVTSSRQISLGNGKTEREGVWAFKQLLQGLKSLRDNVDHRREHFLTKGRGYLPHKQEFLRRLDEMELKPYEKILADPDSKVIQDFAAEVSDLFPQLSISLAGTWITKSNLKEARVLDKHLDSLVYQVKRQGGAGVIIG